MKRPALLLLVIAPLCSGGTILLDEATTLLDGSLYTAGSVYYAAFQLSGSSLATSTAQLTDFQVDSTIFGRLAGDPVFGIYGIGPNTTDPVGVWQTGGMLTLTVDPVEAYSLYAQQLFAPPKFSFGYTLATIGGGAGAPDQFAFQLYGADLNELLYEVALDLPSAVPEPAAAPLVFAVCLLAGCIRSGRSKESACGASPPPYAVTKGRASERRTMATDITP